MYQVIARKYRPSAFQELISQEHVKTTLENAIRQERIAHGYIFSGQRGTGKTTVARIVARCLNCVNGPTPEPCGECASCREITAGGSVDVIEIDAASNRGINEMRELRENVRYRPARDRYKVFIIDEAHQITNEAFNALLKTLEEPPEWVVFILCTTETHKIPTTIASRCQQFSFRSVDFGELVARMKWICEQEGVQADEESLAVLAQAGEGSVRDSLSALDQAIAACGNELRAEELRGLLGRFSLDLLAHVSGALLAQDSTRMLEIVRELESSGQNLQHFCRELSRYFRNLLVAKITGEDTRLIGASPAEQARLRETAGGFSEEDLTRYLQLTLDLFKDLQYSLQPRLHLELGLVKLVHAGRLLPIEQALAEARSGSGASAGAAAAQPAFTLPPPKPMPPKLPAPPRLPQPSAPAAGPSPFARDALRKSAPPAAEAAAAGASEAAAPPAKPGNADLRTALHGALMELGLTFTADAVEHSQVIEEGSDLLFIAPKDFQMALSENDLKRALTQLGLPPRRIKRQVGESPTAAAPIAAAKSQSEEEVTQRALSDPGVKRFQELFPDAQVRAVRNLKD